MRGDVHSRSTGAAIKSRRYGLHYLGISSIESSEYIWNLLLKEVDYHFDLFKVEGNLMHLVSKPRIWTLQSL
jgi:hypothetical protein